MRIRIYVQTNNTFGNLQKLIEYEMKLRLQLNRFVRFIDEIEYFI